MKKTYKIIPIIVAFYMLNGCVAGGIPANEWIINQYDSLDVLKSYCEQMDDTVTLYLSSGIDQATFLSYINQLDIQFSEMEKKQKNDKIKPGTYTENTMDAKEGYEDMWKGLRTLITTMKTDNVVLESKDALSYLYLAYQEQMERDLTKYIDGYNEAIGKADQ